SSNTSTVYVQTWRPPYFPGQGSDSGRRSRPRSLKTPSTFYYVALINQYCQVMFAAIQNALLYLLIRTPLPLALLAFSPSLWGQSFSSSFNIKCLALNEL